MENNDFLKLTTEERGNDGYVESSAEYILPDYDPDVRKLLYTSCEVKSAGKLSGEEQTDFSGIVEYRCVYSDKDGEISEVRFTSDYEYGVSLSGDSLDVDSAPIVQNYQVRVLGPRKLAAKAHLTCENVYTNEKRASCDGSSLGEDVEMDKKNVKCGRIKRVESEERELAEEISRLDGMSLEEVTVISSMSECELASVTREGNEGICKGEFSLGILYRDSEGAVIPISGMISGEGVVSLDGVPEDAWLVCNGRVLSERVEAVPTDDGVNIVANLIVVWEVKCIYNDEHSVITDAYSTEIELENEYGALNYLTYGEPFRESASLDGSIAADSGDNGQLREIILMGARGRITEKSIDDGELSLTLEYKIQGVASYCDNDGKTVYAPIKLSENTEKKVNLSSKKCANSGANVQISKIDLVQKIDGNDVKYTVVAELDIVPYTKHSMQVLTGVVRDEGRRIERTQGRVTVYYTDSEDTVFSVAKKYHTTVSSLLENNRITVETSLGEEKMRLPKRIVIY